MFQNMEYEILYLFLYRIAFLPSNIYTVVFITSPYLLSCSINSQYSSTVALSYILSVIDCLVMVLHNHLLGAVLQVHSLHTHERLQAVLHLPVHGTVSEEVHLTPELSHIHAVRHSDWLTIFLKTCLTNLSLLHDV